MQQADQVREQIKREYRHEPWYEYIGQGAADERIEQLAKHKITVYATDTVEARNKLPESANGINIVVDESEEKYVDDHVDDPCTAETRSWDCVPGGSYLTEFDYCYSATCIVENNNEYFLMTAKMNVKRILLAFLHILEIIQVGMMKSGK